MKNNVIILLSVFVSLVTFNVQALEQYLTTEQFIAEVFDENAPKAHTLWLNKEMVKQADKILSHAPFQLRQRYWKVNNTSAWILEEIGKEEPITAGFVVRDGKILQARILTYRESRGGEVRYPAFLKQFQGVELRTDYFLNRNIDGISGATLSVNAMNRMARLALYYDQLMHQSDEQEKIKHVD
ncbi:MAG: FMN-binding protein [Methylotenera sp.]|nr:FMN-binding protein [Methylotenera sp.]